MIDIAVLLTDVLSFNRGGWRRLLSIHVIVVVPLDATRVVHHSVDDR